MQLPEQFLVRMQSMLPADEYESFLQSYDRPQFQALRLNTLKVSREEWEVKNPFTLRPVPWTENGFYYLPEEHPGKHPYHEAGVYYIQEPSAMSVAGLAGVKPGDRVLDLCAAPGGKSTQLAAALKDQGLLVANEIHPARAKILSQNMERLGIGNAVVTNETPQSLAAVFPGFFDRIVVDAPCSGEGMFRKEEQALLHWSPENVEMCARRQDEILREAAKMLAPGGTLVYSTCTFAPAEDEGSISRFLEEHPGFHVQSAATLAAESPELAGVCDHFSSGHPEWVNGAAAVADTFRLWPHRLEGEGHYAAVLKKDGEHNPLPLKVKMPAVDRAVRTLWEAFAAENLQKAPEGEAVLFGEQLYFLPCPLPLKGLKILRPGLHLGTCKKNRFEPSHALALYLSDEAARRTCPLTALLPEDVRVKAYLRGESIPCDGENGWTLVLADGFSLGWGKVTNGVLKNHYPKGLRRG